MTTWAILADHHIVATGTTAEPWSDGIAAEILDDHIATTGSYPDDWAQTPDGWLTVEAWPCA